MSHNHNFNNNFRGSNYTFRFVPDFPPPPLPPPLLPPIRPQFYTPQSYYPQPQNIQSQENIDKEFVKNFEAVIQPPSKKFKPNATSIIQLREEMQSLVKSVRNIETQFNDLKINVDKLTDEEWSAKMADIEVIKTEITDKIKKCAGEYMDRSRRVLTKRTAKRLRLKRQKEEWKLAKTERTMLMEERSRRIDESLQRIKDDILKKQREDQANLQADAVLREVIRKKQDAKKCIVKLEALQKLRKARQNTAKGRGEAVSEKDAAAFLYDIEKLKILWNQKLLAYENEEAELKAKLTENSMKMSTSIQDTEKEVVANLKQWRDILFGDSDAAPQVDFQGDIQTFLSVRYQWDQHINNDGSPLPVGWIVPSLDQ